VKSKLTYLIFVVTCLYSFVFVYFWSSDSNLKEGEQILSGQVASEIMSGDNFDRLILNVDVSEIKGQKIYIQENRIYE